MKRIILAFAVMAISASAATLSMRDWTGRGFAPDRIAVAVPAGQSFAVTGPDGQAVPAQAEPGVLHFIAAIPPKGEASYTVSQGMPWNGISPVAAQPEGRDFVLRNSLLAVKVPAPVEKTFDKPVAASTLPAPLLGFRGPDGVWKGAGIMRAGLPVRSFSVKKTADGPVFAEVRVRLEFDGGGFYQATVRVTDQVPLAEITEDYDLGRLDSGSFWELDLSRNWNPDEAEFMTAMGQGVAPVTRLSLADLEAKIPPGVNGWDLPNQEALGGTPVRFLFPEGWGARYVTCFGLDRKEERLARSNDWPLVHFVMLHKGNWRRPNSMPVLSKEGKVRLLLPMAVSPRSWLTETGSDVSPFSCHEHDPALPATYGRRQWGLLLAHPALTVKSESGIGPGYSAANLYGTVGLDRYKDYVLDWPDTGAAYPRVFLKTNEVERFRASLTNDSDAVLRKELKDFYVFNGDAAKVPAELKRLDGELDVALNHIMSMLAIGHHHTYHYASVCAHADSVLVWPDLPAADRARIRGKLALLAYLMVEPDVMSHGTGTHHGNPNMGVSRQMDMLNVMALLPDHPMNPAWRDYMGMYMAYKTGSFMAPGGGWFEYGSSYHMHGYGKILRGLMGLYATAGKDDPVASLMREYHRQDFDYFLNLLSPVDSRYGSRLLPGNANSGRGNCSEFLMAQATFADSDPAFAAALGWAWEANGRGLSGLAVPAMARPWIAPKEPALSSRAYPGFGVIFRARQGPEETFLFFRSGYLWSHWPIDQGHLILYAKGAPLIPDQPYQYYTAPDFTYDPYNLIRFGSSSNRFPHAWPDSNILDYRFGGRVEYARSCSGYPDWFNTPGAAPGWEAINRRPLDPAAGQTPGAFTWNRQVLFLKSEKGRDRFVIRDATTGPGSLASWFNLNLLGRKTNVTVRAERVAVATEWPASLDILFPGRKALPFDLHEDNPPIQYGPYSRVTRDLPKDAVYSRDWLGKNGELAGPTNTPAFERQVQLRLKSEPGKDYFWVLDPRGPKDVEAKASVLAPGVMKIESADGVDYVFLSPTNFVYEGDGVVFAGCAGAVRVGKTEVTLSLAAGPGKAGYRGYAVESAVPFEEVVALKGLKPGKKGSAFGVQEAVVTEIPGGFRFVAPGNGYVELSRGPVGVKGKGPFDLAFTSNAIRGTVDGELRTLVCTWPEAIVRPMYRQDGVRWYAGFGDEHSIVKGTNAPQYSLAFGVSPGRHAVEIGEWEWPALPSTPTRRTIALP